MKQNTSNLKMITKLMFRLLPVQILLAAVAAVNGIVSSFFATNFVGIDAMSAVGLSAPITMLLTSISTILDGGAIILCGKYMGQNQQEKMQNVFSLDLALNFFVAIVFMVFFTIVGLFDLSGFMTQDAAVRPMFNQYLLGQAIGTVPLMLGSSFAVFLTLENKGKRTLTASIVYIVVNIIMNWLFVQVLHMEAFGLALASSIGMWIFLLVQAEVFWSGKTHLKIAFKRLKWKETSDIFRIGLPGALSNVYQTARGLIVNRLLELFVGSVGISAFATANNLMGLFWAIPTGMLAVSRLLISVSVGEEDRQTLTDVMRVVLRRYIPVMCVVCALIILLAVPLTGLFYHNPAEQVFDMTAWGFRILPLCMPFAIATMHFTCYGQTSGKQLLVHILALIDGVVCVAGFTAILIQGMGMNSVYYANVLNGIVCNLFLLGYSWVNLKRFPRTMDDLMVVPKSFGVSEKERMDLSIGSLEEVVSISKRIQSFCKERGIDDRRAYLAGLSMEEMAGNIVDHGFHKDKKRHSVDVRVVHKDDDVILRIKDDCVPFDPGERLKMTPPDDPVKNIGLRIVFKTARSVQYQNILGLNVLTIRI